MRLFFLERDIDKALRRMALEEEKNLTETVNDILYPNLRYCRQRRQDPAAMERQHFLHDSRSFGSCGRPHCGRDPCRHCNARTHSADHRQEQLSRFRYVHHLQMGVQNRRVGADHLQHMEHRHGHL